MIKEKRIKYLLLMLLVAVIVLFSTSITYALSADYEQLLDINDFVFIEVRDFDDNLNDGIYDLSYLDNIEVPNNKLFIFLTNPDNDSSNVIVMMNNIDITFYNTPNNKMPLIWIVPDLPIEKVTIVNESAGNIRDQNNNFINYNILLGGRAYVVSGVPDNEKFVSYDLNFVIGSGYGSILEGFYLLDKCAIDMKTTYFYFPGGVGSSVNILPYPFVSYDDAWQEGYDFALELTKNTSGFKGLLAAAFSGIGQILAIELFPNLSIGVIILVPIVLGLVLFILGKKGDN